MKQIEFDVDLKIKDLYAFTMRHTYYSVMGIFSILVGIASLTACVAFFSRKPDAGFVILLLIGLLIFVVQPAMLYLKCKKQIKMNENINAPLHYTLSEKGILVSQKEENAKVNWYEIRKAVYTKRGIYVYMSPVRAFIFPADQCGSDYELIKHLLAEMIEEYKDYVPEEDDDSGEDFDDIVDVSSEEEMEEENPDEGSEKLEEAEEVDDEED